MEDKDLVEKEDHTGLQFKKAKVDHLEHMEKNIVKKLNDRGNILDGQIILKDGTIGVNKFTLGLHCEFFYDHFFNEKKNQVEIEGPKYLMKKIIEYIYTGKMDLNNFSFPEVITLMNVTSSMSLDHLLRETIEYAKSLLGTVKIDEKLDGLINANYWVANFLVQDLATEENLSKVMETDKFKSLSPNTITRLLTLKSSCPQITRLKAFGSWYNGPDNASRMYKEGKKMILESFDTSKFASEEILGVVKQSGFYTNDELLGFLGKIVIDKEKRIASLEERMIGMNQSLNTLDLKFGSLSSRFGDFAAKANISNNERALRLKNGPGQGM